MLGLILPFGATLVAQQTAGSIRGVVTDADFRLPLGAAQVSIVELGLKATTTDQGTYVLSQVPPGQYTLVFAKDGYVRQVRADVVVVAGRLTDVDVALTGDFTDMEEFVVQDALNLSTGTESSLLQFRFESPALMDSISSELLSRAGASDAASALRLVAGASVQNGKSAVVRGLPDRYVSTQLNGVRLPTADEDKRAVELDQFPAVVIDSIRVSKTFTPDQQGDASGGAVDVRLKGIPDEDLFFRWSGQTTYNSQVTGRSKFLTYDGGGVSGLGRDDGRRGIQYDRIGGNWEGAAGVTRGEAPVDHKWSASGGGRHVFGNGLRIGGYACLFYERDSSFSDRGFDDTFWVDNPGDRMTPKTYQGTVNDGDFKTGLFDVTQGSQSVQWGGLATFGVATDHHSIDLVHLQTRTAEDRATLAEDTRGKQYFFPGHEPDNPDTPGHDDLDAAPYLRLETLEYTERTTGSLQLNGRHRFPVDTNGEDVGAPEFDWSIARSEADLKQPDKRQFGSLWTPERRVGSFVIPPTYRQYKPSANFTLGNFQRIYKEIEEESEQYAANFKLPFRQWDDVEGYLKVGVFRDEVDRTFDQETFSNFGDNSSSPGPWQQAWSRRFPFENHPITESEFDVDYAANQRISAWYVMADLPLTPTLNLIGGARVESTRIGIVNDAESGATWFPPGSLAPTQLNPGDADVAFDQDDTLPSIGVVFRPFDAVTVRASYNETVARQTFKELTPILQQEFIGGPIFIGNPRLRMSSIQNYDIRIDVTPYEGGLFSASWFRKDVKRPIEYVQRLGTFDFTTAVNYPKGVLSGFEFETRHDLGHFFESLQGLSIGANATLIESEVTLPDDEAAGFELPNIRAPMRKRDMTDAPEHLFNLFATYDVASTGTQFSAFYTVQGDALVAGAGQSDGNFVPSVYARGYGTLNISVSQKLGEFVKLQLAAKNLTNPEIREVYRSPYIGEDITKTSWSAGVDYTIGIGGEIRF